MFSKLSGLNNRNLLKNFMRFTTFKEAHFGARFLGLESPTRREWVGEPNLVFLWQYHTLSFGILI